MAAEADRETKPEPSSTSMISDESAPSSSTISLLASYLGIGFTLFLANLPKNSVSYISSLQSRNRILALKLFQAEEQLRQLRSRRKEEAKANARVVEIFAGHRNGWREEERRLLGQIDAGSDEIAALRARIAELEGADAELRACVERLEQEVAEREELLEIAAARRGEDEADPGEKEGEKYGEFFGDLSGTGKDRVSEGTDQMAEACFLERSRELDEMMAIYAQRNDFRGEFYPPPPPLPEYFPLQGEAKPWIERSNSWQDMQYDSLESMYNVKHPVPRRESPWKLDGESSGVPDKLKLLEQELINLEKLGIEESSKIPSLMRKQAKRYQSLAGKIDDLCRRMQVSDPCDPTLTTEFRTQRQTEFLIEAFRLQHRATETRQKLNSLQSETAKISFRDDLTTQTKLSTKRSLDSIRSYFREIQRNLEIWLARIMGDLEGILARDGASRVRDYYLSPHPFVR
ncbi:uncharacterized protein [Typha latifolia]|uniref:uncharacterized protein n=1 Tax=Typha latifolia TaxID=4733 RepID=UPI003C2C0463